MKSLWIFAILLFVPFVFAQETPGPDTNEDGIDSYVHKPCDENSERCLYSGYVDIETLTLEEIKQELENRGCPSSPSPEGGCYYSEEFVITEEVNTTGRAIPVGKESEENNPEGFKVIVVHPLGISFGPTGFALSESRLYAQRDIEGPYDLEKFKSELNEDLGKFEFIEVKGSWTTDAIDSSDIVYAAGDGGGSQILGFIQSVEGRSPISSETAILIAASTLALLFGFLAYRRLRKH